jgi:hypothetical protein
MGDVQITFEIFIVCSIQCPSYFFQCTLFILEFLNLVLSFDLCILQMLEHLIGPWPFEGPKRNLAHYQTSLPIFLEGNGFISNVAITLAAFLGSLTLIFFSLTYWFLFSPHLFLLLDSGSHQFKYPPCPLIIESSLRPLALGDLWVCFFIEDLINKQIEWLQDFILECLHQHTFFTLSFRQDI